MAFGFSASGRDGRGGSLVGRGHLLQVFAATAGRDDHELLEPEFERAQGDAHADPALPHLRPDGRLPGPKPR
jgi:hypothetical protein